MKIVLQDQTEIVLDIFDTPMAKVYLQAAKHLQHVPVPFRAWDSTNYLRTVLYPDLVDRLIHYASVLSIPIDKSKCLDKSQTYFNSIHQIYEKGYNGKSEWLDFHEHIHLCENHGKPLRGQLNIDYREKAGPLTKKVDPSWVRDLTTSVNAGDVFLEWAELGKIPYAYWDNNEPDNFERLIELAKPWLYSKPKLIVALNDFDLLKGVDIEGFNAWWPKYKTQWCEHWNFPDWTITHMHGVSVIGQLADIELLTQKLQSHITPIRIKI